MQLEDYLRELNKIKLLTPEEEQALWQAYSEAGDDSARHRLIQAYQPLVFKQALPYRRYEGIMDLLQEGTVGLIEAVEGYEPKRGTAFSLFAVHRIRGRILNFLKKAGTEIACMDAEGADGLSRKDLLPARGASVAELVEANELTSRVREALDRLPGKEKLVLEQVYLQSEEIKDIAQRLNVSASYIYRLQKTGIRRIRGMMSRFMQNW